jgi:hypothetical protein
MPSMPAFQVSGTVVDCDGQPVAGAMVALRMFWARIVQAGGDDTEGWR